MSDGNGSEAREKPARVAILVLGMHRSGTSALTGALGLCGAALPAHLIPANANNPKGYFESETLYRMHDELLAEAGTSWSDPCSFPSAWFESAAADDWVERLVAVLDKEIGAAPLFAIKDPRLCRLVPLWIRVIERFGAEPRFVLQVRDPVEVADSLRASRKLVEPTAHLLWIDHFLAAERDTRGRPRAFVTYDALLAGWRGVVARVEADLAIALPRRARAAEAEVDAFLSGSLRHQVATHPGTAAASVHPWVDSAYRWALTAAATEGAVDTAAALEEIDALGRTWQVAEAVIGPVLAAADERRRRAESDLETVAGERDEKRALLGELRDDVRRLVDANRASLRWAVDRTRGPGERADGALAAVVRAIDAVEPREVPGLASTGLLIAELRMRVRELEDERAARAEELAALAARLGEAERLGDERGRALAERTEALGEREADATRLRSSLADTTAKLAILDAEVREKARECERLTAECARLLAESAAAAEAEGSGSISASDTVSAPQAAGDPVPGPS